MMPMADKGLEKVQRSITDHERELIEWLIDHGTYEDKAHLIDQIGSLTVCGCCSCGCPTMYFALNGRAVPMKGGLVMSDYLATVDGQEVGIMLFHTDGLLCSLEVYSCAGSDEPFGLPDLRTIRPY
jgi:hypothetical protein